ncbi:NADH:ubiquinone oxidoreductase subunit 6 (chain J) [Archaeoglobus sulfaticallidus PM70-1]|uniref:NADH:ubiquinone oxidoreductase subunit 6 (Chain J) n=1 Tax=Archaeoglobus sulfaticallidus PM70-1 TaxID=387631 RepID=N0BMC1_9EURY|nr:NADH-quinone oxidoreductase subunit J [Archaeoglobus sulfaticallidus]AGK61776.1 NADH:ubiquinone oxidoreductase subunit 6 (chain J) [Archaeoglobus sulfaticallidus PM70-1]
MINTIEIVLWAIILFSAIMVVHAREVFNSALYMALLFIATAGLFILLDAEFVAVVQTLIYAGAVTVILLFAIMLTKREEGKDMLRTDINPLKVISIILFALAIIPLAGTSKILLIKKGIYGSPYIIASELFERYVLHFELIAILLLVTLISSVYLARRD